MGWRDWLGLVPTPDDFALQLIRMAERRGSGGWTYEPSEFMLRGQDGDVQVSLGNLYLEYSQANGRTRRDLLEKYVAVFLASKSVPELWQLAAQGIYVVVRSRFSWTAPEIADRTEAKPFRPIVKWPWLGDLTLVLVYDFGPHIAQVVRDRADVWGQALEELRERALTNLRALSRPRWEPAGNGVFCLVSEVGYEESLLLVASIFDSLKVRGNPVVAVPNRGRLLAASSHETSALAALIELAQHAIQSAPWPLSGTLLERTANGWQLFEPPAELAAGARALQTISLAITYRDQEEALHKHCAKIGDHVYVARFDTLGLRQDPQVLHSWCTLGAGTSQSFASHGSHRLRQGTRRCRAGNLVGFLG
jgi:hypothetical protein